MEEFSVNIFSIGETNFEVDFLQSSIKLDVPINGMQELSIHIYDDNDVFVQLVNRRVLSGRGRFTRRYFF